eukprot:g70141.t1
MEEDDDSGTEEERSGVHVEVDGPSSPSATSNGRQGLELFLSCRNLYNVDYGAIVGNVSDSYCKVYLDGVLVGQTEVVLNDLNPDFLTRLSVEYATDSAHKLSVEVWDAEGKETEKAKQHFLGRCVLSLDELTSSPDMSCTLPLDATEQGQEQGPDATSGVSNGTQSSLTKAASPSKQLEQAQKVRGTVSGAKFNEKVAETPCRCAPIFISSFTTKKYCMDIANNVIFISSFPTNKYSYDNANNPMCISSFAINNYCIDNANNPMCISSVAMNKYSYDNMLIIQSLSHFRHKEI